MNTLARIKKSNFGQRKCSTNLQRNLFSHPALVLCIVFLTVPFSNCGGGWDAYEETYQTKDTGTPGEPWSGPEKVFVVLGQDTIETPLAGIVTSSFKGIAAVRLSDLIDASEITTDPTPYRYDFTATDGYNLLKKRFNDKQLLPSWENMNHGFLYWNDEWGLTVGWEEQPWGSAVSAYNVKLMDGGSIELLDP